MVKQRMETRTEPNSSTNVTVKLPWLCPDIATPEQHRVDMDLNDRFWRYLTGRRFLNWQRDSLLGRFEQLDRRRRLDPDELIELYNNARLQVVIAHLLNLGGPGAGEEVLDEYVFRLGAYTGFWYFAYRHAMPYPDAVRSDLLGAPTPLAVYFRKLLDEELSPPGGKGTYRILLEDVGQLPFLVPLIGQLRDQGSALELVVENASRSDPSLISLFATRIRRLGCRFIDEPPVTQPVSPPLSSLAPAAKGGRAVRVSWRPEPSKLLDGTALRGLRRYLREASSLGASIALEAHLQLSLDDSLVPEREAIAFALLDALGMVQWDVTHMQIRAHTHGGAHRRFGSHWRQWHQDASISNLFEAQLFAELENPRLHRVSHSPYDAKLLRRSPIHWISSRYPLDILSLSEPTGRQAWAYHFGRRMRKPAGAHATGKQTRFAMFLGSTAVLHEDRVTMLRLLERFQRPHSVRRAKCMLEREGFHESLLDRLVSWNILRATS